MTAQQLAQLITPLIGEVKLPLTQQNVTSAAALYETLGMMARGELILAAANSVPGDGSAK
jgi:hypothetical protein